MVPPLGEADGRRDGRRGDDRHRGATLRDRDLRNRSCGDRQALRLRPAERSGGKRLLLALHVRAGEGNHRWRLSCDQHRSRGWSGALNCEADPARRGIVFAAGHREGGAPRVAVTVCPSRLLAEAPWASEFVEWWMWSVRWDPSTGNPLGAPRWPFRGGLLRQPRRIFEACKVLAAEWPYVKREGKAR